MEELFSYGSEILAWGILLFGIVYGAMKKIAPLTKTTKDDEILAKVDAFLATVKPLLDKIEDDPEKVLKEKKAKKSKQMKEFLSWIKEARPLLIAYLSGRFSVKNKQAAQKEKENAKIGQDVAFADNTSDNDFIKLLDKRFK